jgi:fluoride exporter
MDAWARILVLSLGGALGVNARYWLGVLMARWTDPRFPWATVTINITGSFAIGFLAVILAHHWPHPFGRMFVVTGFLGGYTTFSSFAYESLKLWEDGSPRLSIANTVGSVAAGLAAVALGVALARSIVGQPTVDDRPGIVDRVDAEGLPAESFLDGEIADG